MRWFLASIHDALHFLAHRLQLLHFVVSIIGRKRAKREKKPNTVPTGQMVLQYVRPPNHDIIATTTNETAATMATGDNDGDTTLLTILPYELYGASKAASGVSPATNATTKITSMPYLSHFFSPEYEKRDFFFFLSPLILDITSCITPSGHITEQYALPTSKVSTTNANTVTTFNASKAGKNCILAVHPNHSFAMPVESINNAVTDRKNNVASMILILLNIFFSFY